MVKQSEYLAHVIALSIAILGPLINAVFIDLPGQSPPGMYVYWTIVLVFYILILIPFTYKIPLTLTRLIFLGITVEDFFSNIWKSLLTGIEFLPFCNWYTEHFPFIGGLGEPTSLILVPRWYFLSMTLYVLITIFQFRSLIFKNLKKKPEFFQK